MQILHTQRLNVPRTTAQTFGSTVTSVGASGTQGPTKQDWANPPKSELIEFDGVGIKGGWEDGLQINVKQPASVDQFGVSQAPTSGVLTWDDSPYHNPLPISLFTIYERYPAIYATNNLPVAIIPAFRWTGWRYQLARMSPADFKAYEDSGGAHSIVTIGGFQS